ncbi:hypothetical protein, partial [Varibaculum cambriense]|uniref:hypothetical protein n=1 Tax=Varibaculum cambriense TaxID=184870 RepID=UPI00241C82FD
QKLAGDLSVGVVVGMAFPDQIGRLTSNDGVYQLSGSGAARLDNDSSLSTSKWLAIAEIGVRKGGNDLIRLAAPLTEELALELGSHLKQEKHFAEFRDGKIFAWKQRSLGESRCSARKQKSRIPSASWKPNTSGWGLIFYLGILKPLACVPACAGRRIICLLSRQLVTRTYTIIPASGRY